jgi:hypothetical protein
MDEDKTIETIIQVQQLAQLQAPQPWTPASPQMTDRDLDWSQLAQTANVELLKGFLNI